MCGGKELVKQDGMFVCQSCGAKYSVEEAKKMMVEIDTSAKMENALKNARRAMENKNYKPAQEYYEIILKEEPDNWEASFYSVYSKAMQSPHAYTEISKSCIETALKNIKILNDTIQQNEAVKQISKDLFDLASKKFSKDSLDYMVRMLVLFGIVLVSEFGKNEFTISISTQCHEAALKMTNRQYYADLLEKGKSFIGNSKNSSRAKPIIYGFRNKKNSRFFIFN
jgi:uncharacterized Zn finger protein (UPF0148 family)